MSKPIAVLISDIHYNIHTLPLADAAMRLAIAKANEIDVPLIVAGDLHDSKANLRAECVNAMIETFNQCLLEPIVLIGNHDRINEKSKEHSLNFLSTYFKITDGVKLELPDGDFIYTIGYYSDVEALKSYLKTIPKGSTIIMHQGLNGSNAGEYIQDKTALSYEDVQDFRVISGHYHTRQDIKTGRPRKGAVGMFSYIGNPYTLNFGEAKDPEKGFQILMDDGTLEFVPANLRRHVVIEVNLADGTATNKDFNKDDLLWVKVKGTKEQLINFKKESLGIDQPFKLDLIPIDFEIQVSNKHPDLTDGELLDKLIDSLPDTTDERKIRLKELWRGVVCG